MWANRIEDLVAYELASEFKREVYRLVKSSPVAGRDFKFRDQIHDSASGIVRTLTEGFHRKRDTEFANYLHYSLGSVGETKGHLQDGIDRGHFAKTECREAFALAKRCHDVMTALLRSIERSIEREKLRKKEARRRGTPRSDKR